MGFARKGIGFLIKMYALCAGKGGSESPRRSRSVCPTYREEQRLNTLPAPVSLIFTRALNSL